MLGKPSHSAPLRNLCDDMSHEIHASSRASAEARADGSSPSIVVLGLVRAKPRAIVARLAGDTIRNSRRGCARNVPLSGYSSSALTVAMGNRDFFLQEKRVTSVTAQPIYMLQDFLPDGASPQIPIGEFEP
jgi:hypothetical protein